MPEVEQAVPVILRLRDVEARSDERYQDGVENVVEELVKELCALLQVGQRKLIPLIVGVRRLKPRNGRNLDAVQPS